MTLKEWNRLQIEEINSPFNRWVTGEECHREPTLHECALHYTNNGGPKAFAKAHRLDLNEETGEFPAHRIFKH